MENKDNTYFDELQKLIDEYESFQKTMDQYYVGKVNYNKSNKSIDHINPNSSNIEEQEK